MAQYVSRDINTLVKNIKQLCPDGYKRLGICKDKTSSFKFWISMINQNYQATNKNGFDSRHNHWFHGFTNDDLTEALTIISDGNKGINNTKSTNKKVTKKATKNTKPPTTTQSRVKLKFETYNNFWDVAVQAYNLSFGAQAIYCFLWKKVNPQRLDYYIKREEIMKHCNIKSTTTFSKYVKELEDKGLIIRSGGKRHQGMTHYRLVIIHKHGLE